MNSKNSQNSNLEDKSDGSLECKLDDTPNPMTDDDVNKTIARMATLDGKQISEICDGYVRQIKILINTVKKILHPTDDEDEIVELDRVLRLIGLIASDEIFIRSKDKIWHARQHILNKNADWFIKRDYSKNIKKDHKQVMIETIIRIVRVRYPKLSPAEQEQYWIKAIGLLSLVAKFKKLTGET